MLKRLLFENLFAKVIALLVSVLLWFYVSERQQFEELVSVPLRLENVPETLTLLGDVPGTAQVVIRGQGHFLRHRVKGLYLAVDLSDADQGRYVRSLTPADVTVPLDEDVEVLSVRSPTQLKADLDRVAVRRVHVAATAQHDPAGGFARVGAAVVNPDTVTIRGAESLVSGIQSLQTEPISLGGATRMVVARAKVDLGGLQRVTCDPEQVAVAIPVEKVEALTLANVRVRANADTTRWSVRCVPDVVEVGLTGPLSLMAGLRDRPPAMHIDVSRLGAGRYFFDVSVEKSGRVRLLPRDSVGPLAGVPDSLRTPEREPGARSLDAWIALPEGVFVARVDPYRFHIVVQQRGPRRDEGVPVPTS